MVPAQPRADPEHRVPRDRGIRCKTVGLASQAELDALKKRVRELERAAGMTASGRTARTAPAKKAAAKKSTAKKSTAKKTTAREPASSKAPATATPPGEGG